jgi:hypothetical protein
MSLEIRVSVYVRDARAFWGRVFRDNVFDFLIKAHGKSVHLLSAIFDQGKNSVIIAAELETPLITVISFFVEETRVSGDEKVGFRGLVENGLDGRAEVVREISVFAVDFVSDYVYGCFAGIGAVVEVAEGGTTAYAAGIVEAVDALVDC